MTPEQRARLWRIGLGVSVSAIAIVGVLFGVATLHTETEQRMRASEVAIEIAWPTVGEGGPSMLPVAVQAALETRVREAVGTAPDPLRIEPLKAASRALATSGWTDGEPRVVRTSSSELHIEPVWREWDGVVVRRDGTDYAIDSKLRLLPQRYAADSFAGEDGPRYRYVKNPHHSPPRDSGFREFDYQTAWQGVDVQASVDLLMLLKRESFYEQVAGIDAGSFRVQGILEIETTHGTTVIWGRPVGEFNPGEASDEEKIASLRRTAADARWGGRIDAGRPKLDISAGGAVVIEHPARGGSG